MLSRTTLAVGTIAASLAFASPAFAAKSAATSGSPTEYVSNSGSDTNSGGSDNTCRLKSNPCLTIQHAINEAPAAGTINVAAGHYPEQLTIAGKNLTIVGAGASSTTIDPSALATVPDDPNSPGTAQADIVTFEFTTGGGLKNVTVDGSGFTETDCGTDYVGVYALDATETLSGDTVTGINHDTGSAGCQAGPNGGVYVTNDGNGTPVASPEVIMNNDVVSNYNKNGISCETVLTSCTIKNSTVTGDGATGVTAQNGILLYAMSVGVVTDTTVENNTYTSPNYPSSFTNASGILVINSGTITLTGNTTKSNDENIVGLEDTADFTPGPTEGLWQITGNTVSGATNDTGQNETMPVPLGNTIGDGIDLYGTSAEVDVDKNKVNGNADWGIGLFGVSGAHVGAKNQGNTVSSNADDGIYLGENTEGSGASATTTPSSGNTIASNTASKNGDDGILVPGDDSSENPQATGNTFKLNILAGNTRYDAEDLSAGLGTAGTADTWTSNTCTPRSDSNPTGLCK